MKDLFKLSLFKRKINLARFFVCLFVLPRHCSMSQDCVGLNRKSNFNYNFFLTVTKKKVLIGLEGHVVKENQTCVQLISNSSLFPRIIKIRKELTVLEVTLFFLI